jgi:hypothetical protein
MAKLLCQVTWDGKQVVRNYQLVSLDAADKVEFVTTDKAPFAVRCPDSRVAHKFGLTNAPNTNANDHLYVVPPPPVDLKLDPAPEGANLPCGTLDSGGNFVSWKGSGLFPPDN